MRGECFSLNKLGGTFLDIRLADSKDVDELIQLQWDFIDEHDKSGVNSSLVDLNKGYHSFFEKMLTSGQWLVWVVEYEGKIVSHLYIELIQKESRPGCSTHPFAYITNIYTVPIYRNMGIESKLLVAINDWILENEYDLVIIWVSDEGIPYYQNNSCIHCKEPIEYFLS